MVAILNFLIFRKDCKTKHSAVGPTLAIGHMVGRFCRRWADVGPTLASQPTLWLDVCIFCRRWADVGLPTNTQVRCLYFANVGPTADFYSRWRRAIIGDLG